MPGGPQERVKGLKPFCLGWFLVYTPMYRPERVYMRPSSFCAPTPNSRYRRGPRRTPSLCSGSAGPLLGRPGSHAGPGAAAP